MTEIILVSATGRDRAGLTAALTEVLGRYDVQVLDIGQAVIHDSLAWGMVIEVPEAAVASPLFKELVFRAHELELNVRFSPIDSNEYAEWVSARGQPRHIITLLGRG
ncbi:MAG: ACT domain-containing protein, partial [Pseudomonadota bacterium]